MKKYDIVIVGGGIAGVATGEIFARSGFKTLVIEKHEKLCMETSGLHHEWFHFGSLYSIFPNNQFFRTMVGGIEDILDYYRDFAGMNLRIDGFGKLAKVNRANSWFRSDNLEYIIATTRDADFSLRKLDSLKQLSRKILMKVSWQKAIKQFVARHNRFHEYDWRTGCASRWIPRAGWLDYSNEHLQAYANDEIDLDPATHISMPSYDCPMNAYNIISDLLKSLLANGGEISAGNEFVEYTKKGETIVVLQNSNQAVETKKLILASGKALQEQSKGAFAVESVLSPLLVVSPKVCSSNVVRLTPFLEQTINHLAHSFDGKEYSVIGGGYFAPTDDGDAIRKAGAQLLEKAESVFPRMTQSQLTRLYFGTKSEIISTRTKRNYLYKIEEIEENVFAVVPGKFSLAFSLAINAFKQIMGDCPRTYTTYYQDVDVARFVALTKHKSIVKEFLASEFIDEPPAKITVVEEEESQLAS